MKRVFRLRAGLWTLLVVVMLVSCAGDGNPPELEQRSYAHTSGLVDRDGQIVVHFRQEAGPQATGALKGSGPFRFTPAIAGSAEWQGSQMLVFTPDKPLPPGREYRCRLDLAQDTSAPDDNRSFMDGQPMHITGPTCW